MKKVSIIIPVFNGEKFLKKTMEYCMRQNYRNIEIIIIDDGSTDSSMELVNKYRDHENIFIYENGINKGIAKTVNYGIKVAKGEYILVLGQDDIIAPSHVSNIMEFFDSYVSFIHTNAYVINDKDEITGVLKNDKHQKVLNENIKYNLAKENFINSCGCIFRRKFALKVGLWEENNRFRNFGEWLFWIKLAYYGEVLYLPLKTSYYRNHESNTIKTYNNGNGYDLITEYKIRCRKYAYYHYQFNNIQILLLNIHRLKCEIFNRIRKRIPCLYAILRYVSKITDFLTPVKVDSEAATFQRKDML